MSDGRDDLVDESVVDGLACGEHVIAQRIVEDPVQRLSGLLRDQAQDGVADVPQIVGLQFDVGGVAADTGGPLVQKHFRVGEGIAFARRAATQQELSGAVGHSEVHCRNVVGDQVHGVGNGQHRGHRTTGRIDPQCDVGGRIVGGQQDQLRAQLAADLIVEG